MENKELNLLMKAKSIIDCAKIIYNINYTNGRIKKQIVDYCNKQYSLDIILIIKNNKNEKKYCLQCGKELKKKQKRFCCSSCAAKYNNKGRKHSEETKQKIAKSISEHSEKKIKRLYEHICLTCNKIFTSKYKNIKYCSQKCVSSSEEVKNKIRKKVNERINNGTFSGWKKRNIKSYPEMFFEGVLINNNISFIREDFSTKKYFLDFLIEKNNKKIDLEIDGKQHTYPDRKKHDEERDDFLTKNGYIVYRIAWNEINTELGKKQMKEKIDNFIKFLCNL